MIHPETQIGHVHLSVSELETSLKFYRDIMGFEVTARYGDSAVFLSAGGYHHHIGLNTWQSKDGPRPARGTTGLYHFAILFQTRLELAKTFKRLLDADWPISGASDHGVSEAIYLEDPDGIGIEIYADRPKDQWKVGNDGIVEMVTEPLDVDNLLGELNQLS